MTDGLKNTGGKPFDSLLATCVAIASDHHGMMFTRQQAVLQLLDCIVYL